MFAYIQRYRTYRALSIETPWMYIVHDNLKTFKKYSGRSVQYISLPQFCVHFALGHCTIECYHIQICNVGDQRQKITKDLYILVSLHIMYIYLIVTDTRRNIKSPNCK